MLTVDFVSNELIKDQLPAGLQTGNLFLDVSGGNEPVQNDQIDLIISFRQDCKVNRDDELQVADLHNCSLPVISLFYKDLSDVILSGADLPAARRSKMQIMEL